MDALTIVQVVASDAYRRTLTMQVQNCLAGVASNCICQRIAIQFCVERVRRFVEQRFQGAVALQHAGWNAAVNQAIRAFQGVDDVAQPVGFR